MAKEKISYLRYMAASTPLMLMRTSEYDDANSRIVKDVLRNFGGKEIYRWDIHTGITKREIAINSNGAEGLRETKVDDYAEGDPTAVVELIQSLCSELSGRREHKGAVVVAMDYNIYLKIHAIWRGLIELRKEMSQHKISLIIISPTLGDIPAELEGYLSVVDYELPNVEELKRILDNFVSVHRCEMGCSEQEIINYGKGMRREEFESALYLSISDASKNGAIDTEYLQKQKEQRMAKSDTLKLLKSKNGFEDICGLDRLKQFTKGMINSKMGRGVLIMGVPGCGKSALAASLGQETGRTTISMDFGNLMGGIVGQTEQKTEEALKFVDAMAPCILFIDEIEKGLAGTSGYMGDSGTSARQGGMFLKWLNDHTSDVYVVATANSIDKMPPEYLRAERWDGIFFVDMPTSKQADAIYKMYKSKYNLSDEQCDVSELRDLTGAEIKSVCRITKALNTRVSDARSYIAPIVKSMPEKITALRTYAGKFAIEANGPEWGEANTIENIGTHTRQTVVI